MKNSIAEMMQAYKELNERFRCEHVQSKLRKRTVKGGAIQYVEQCLNCGKAMTQPAARDKAIYLNNGKEPEPFDDELLARWEKSHGDGFKEIETQFGKKSELETAEFKKWYAGYLESEKWRQLAKAVMERAEGLCEGCRERPATDVHHLTYRDVGDEFLFQLVAICRECHARYHTRHGKETNTND